MNSICAIMDAQGFVKEGVFYPRELSIISHELRMSLIVDSGLSYTGMNLKDRKTNKYISNNLLGLSMKNFSPNRGHNLSYDSSEQIRNLYLMVLQGDKEHLGIKNQQLAQVLDMLDIPYIDLNQYNCPSVKELSKSYKTKPCNFHSRQVPDRDRLRCAEKKCNLLWKWMNSLPK